MNEYIINMSDSRESSKFINGLRLLKGSHRITVVKNRPRRTDRQNRFFHPCFCQSLADYLSAQGEFTTMQDAKDLIKTKCLMLTRIDTKTGAIIEYVGHTSALDTKQFNEFLDRAAFWLNSMFDIIVPDPSEYHEKIASPDPTEGE